ncbi:Membrane cofactor protein [Takifugu flavidus]|uniref:Membrane cofactor protein n=1 Tax=Takifugu flavidus TaxID=433684 RepID=A0A5C6N5C8_9TELE|nr:Membrane cofactor protein [Takifugu flavidus]
MGWYVAEEKAVNIWIDNRSEWKDLSFICPTFGAQCQKPQATENIVLSEAALLLNSFPEGSEVILECGRGYEKESGSGATVCTNREWSKPNLICKEMDCGLPKSEPNMKFNTSQGTRFRALVRVFCDKGYYLSGSSFKQCYPRGWVGRAKCKIVTCDQPGNVTNGMNLWNSEDRPKYGDTIEYLCNGGYTLVGKEKIVCTETGKYDSHPPECQG